MTDDRINALLDLDDAEVPVFSKEVLLRHLKEALLELVFAREENREVRRDRDAAQHCLIVQGVVPGQEGSCRCEECRRLAKEMAEAGYLSNIADHWWDESKEPER